VLVNLIKKEFIYMALYYCFNENINFIFVFSSVGEQIKLLCLSSCLWILLFCAVKALHLVVVAATMENAIIMVSEQ